MPDKPSWMLTQKWLSVEQLGLRFGLTAKAVHELVSQGRKAGTLPRRGGKTSKFPTKYDGDSFGRLPGLKEQQQTKEARYFQWEHNLRDIMPTAWEVLLQDDFL